MFVVSWKVKNTTTCSFVDKAGSSINETILSEENTSEAKVFWKTLPRVDYCTLSDFLNHILDHGLDRVPDYGCAADAHYKPYCILQGTHVNDTKNE
jgi:hypothetical protein